MSNAGGTIYDPKNTVGAAVARVTFDVSVQAAIKVVQGYVPVLAVTPLKQVFEFVVSKFMEVLYKAIEDETSFLIIDIKVNKEAKEYKESLASLQAAIVANKSKEEIDREKQKFKDAIRDLVNLRAK